MTGISIALALTVALFLGTALPVLAGGLPAPAKPERPASAEKKRGGDEKALAQAIARWAREGKCRKVVAAADRFAARHPNSPDLPTVLWHQAECYRTISEGR